jgi:radical SAM protein with 4Fe4S-binding SPASM domain
VFIAEHFAQGLPQSIAMELFKKSVKSISIAISSYCNRQCPYCPNSIVDRHSEKKRMSDKVYFNFLRNLCKIDYAGEICLHRYNEPLEDKDYVLARIVATKAILPRCTIAVYTNGDYLDRDYVLALRDANVSRIDATSHTQDKDTSLEQQFKNQEKHLARIGLPFEYIVNDAAGGLRVAQVDCGPSMGFLFMARDFHHRDANGVLYMSDRGGSLPVTRNYVRDQPCWAVFNEMQIEWDGRLLPCCEINPDAYSHDNYVLGQLTDNSDLFLEWCNPRYVAWRKEMFRYGPKEAPCQTCTINKLTDDTPRVRALVGACRKEWGLD